MGGFLLVLCLGHDRLTFTSDTFNAKKINMERRYHYFSNRRLCCLGFTYPDWGNLRLDRLWPNEERGIHGLGPGFISAIITGCRIFKLQKGKVVPALYYYLDSLVFSD